MRKCALLVLLSILSISSAFAQTFSTVGNLVVNGVFQNSATGAHSYKIATLPANNGSDHDFLRILVTLNPGYAGSTDSYIDATFSNRGGFTYQYSLLGASVTSAATLAAYRNGDSTASVDIYIVFSGANQYTLAGYTMLENEQETPYPTPTDCGCGATPPGTLVFDASNVTLSPPTLAFNQSSQLLGAAADSAAAPVYTWSGDTNTGMFSPGANTIGFTTNGAERLRIDQNGNVGIGVTAPANRLTVSQDTTYTSSASGQIMIQGSTNASQHLAFGLDTTHNYGWINAALSGSSAYPLILEPSGGKVGIGTTSPTSLLSVGSSSQFAVNTSGGVTASSVTFPSGTQNMPWTGVLCGGDYAEAVDTVRDKESYEPGDVLVIAEGPAADVKKSAEPYATTVAGIFATKPGVVGRRQTLPKDGEEVPMAMVGIVPTKVTAENGPIRRGDLLVTSSQSGYAMKGTDRSRMLGAVIGKAMGSLDSGTGVIEVLVTLQ